jgi:transposase
MVPWRAEGYSVADIAKMSGATRPTVYKWPQRYAESGVEGLADLPKPGRPPGVPDRIRSRLVALTRTSPPTDTGLSHWSSRERAAYLKRTEGIAVSHNLIAALWRERGPTPHRRGTFKLSADPEFAEKVIDVIGLYLDPPTDAVVPSVDEKTQVQASARTQPRLPLAFGKSEKRAHDYLRHGTTNLFAALDTQTGRVVGKCRPKRRMDDFLAFMDHVVARHADRDLHVVLDNLSTHSGNDVEKWLAEHPHVTFSLYAGRKFLVESDRDLVRYPHSPGDTPRDLRVAPTPRREDQ